MSRRWFLVATYAGAEWFAFTTLLERGVHAFYPRLVASARRGRWPQPSFIPQYPGYIFAGLDSGSSLETIKRVLGVKTIVRNGSDVVVISSAEIDLWRKRWLKQYRHHVPRRRIFEPIRPGALIAIPSGAFVNMPARIESIDKSGYARAKLGNLEVTFHVSALPESVRASAKPSEISL